MEENFDFGNYNFEEAMYNDNPREQNQNRVMLESGEDVLFEFAVDSGSENSPPSPTESEDDIDNENQPPSPEEPPSPHAGPINSAESEIMQAVKDALINEKKILIECPQLLGRKIAILKAVLKFWQWRRNGMQFEFDFDNIDIGDIPIPSKIYIGTRDFRETKKLMEEMKEKLEITQLLWKIRLSVLDHRKNFCGNEEVTRNYTHKADINHACRKLVGPFNANIPSSSKKARQEEHGCEYYCNSSANFDGALPIVRQSDGVFGPQHQVNDIEDIMLHCRVTNRCAYHDLRYAAHQADLVICPVEFLLSPYLRDEYDIKLDGAIVIIDDGYDLENLCNKEATIDLTLEHLNSATSFLRGVTEHQQEEESGLAELLEFLHNLSQWVTRTAREDNRPRPDREDILEIINQFNVDAISTSAVTRQILQYAENSALSIPDTEASIIDKLGKFITTLDLLCNNNDSFTVKLTQRDSPSPRCNRMVTTLQIICADPSLVFEPLGNTAALIIGSNIIAPYSTFDSEFGVPFEEKLIKIQDPTIRERLLVLYTGHGPTGVKFSMDFESRNEPEIMKEAGLALVEFCKNIPNGKVVLFHSKSYLMKIRDYWRRTSIHQDGSGAKIMEEIRSSTENVFCELDVIDDKNGQRLMMQAFEAAATTNKGAVLLALHRGKMYKNWDLKSPQDVRGILHVSLPYGPWVTDNAILAKRKFLEIKFGERNCLQNKDWYHAELFRTANQSFCYTNAQNENGWGIVIFLDSRMPGESHQFNDFLPDWINRRVPPVYYKKHFDGLMGKVRDKIREWDRIENV